MSNTPRTDAAIYQIPVDRTDDDLRFVTKAEFARQLETELATATQRLKIAMQELPVDEVESHFRELETDIYLLRSVLVKVRLDYDHPWPNEDKKTLWWRSQILGEIDAFLPKGWKQ